LEKHFGGKANETRGSFLGNAGAGNYGMGAGLLRIIHSNDIAPKKVSQ
jgi:hypothetical protein